MNVSRALAWVSLSLLALACHPSATVQRTTPVANLQTYRAVLVRVSAAAPEASPHIPELGQLAVARLRQLCQFEQVLMVGQAPSYRPDLIIDLNILRSFRGGEGLVQNPNLATVDVTLVLSDGINDELIGTAEFRGKSSAVQMGNALPESQAVDAVAGKVAELMATSGCTGTRIARALEEPEPPSSQAEGDGISPEDRQQAETLNDEGKELFRNADIPGARARFEAAVALAPDPRFFFNLCLAHESLKNFPVALQTCQRVLDSNPSPRLVEKATERMRIIREKQGS